MDILLQRRRDPYKATAIPIYLNDQALQDFLRQEDADGRGSGFPWPLYHAKQKPSFYAKVRSNFENAICNALQ